MKVRVIHPLGVYICRHGERKLGETFDDLPDELALELLEQYPDRLELVEDEQEDEV